MDPFEDLFAEAAAKPAPARSKFMPKAKPGPKKGPSVLKPCVASVHSSGSNAPAGPSSGLSNIEKPKAPATREEVTHFEEPGLQLENVEPVTRERDGDGDVAVSVSNVSKSHNFGSSAAGIDPLGNDDGNLGDLLPVPNQPAERGKKFQPKGKARQSSDAPALDSSASFPVSTNERPSEDGDWPSSLTKSAEENADVLSHLEPVDDLLTASMNKEEHTPGNFHEGNETFPSPSNYAVEKDTDAEKISGLSVQNSQDSSHFMEADFFPDLEAAERLPEITRSRGGKFIPKPKPRDGTKNPDSRTCEVPITDNEQDPLFHFESENMDDGTVPGTLNDHVAPSSFDPSNSEDLEHLELNPDPLENLSQGPKTASMDNTLNAEGRRSSRHLRNRVDAPHLVDESGADPQDDQSFDPEPNSSMNGEDGVGENGDQSTFEKKKATRKPRATKSKDGKPSRKRKGAEEASEQSTEEPKKKFSHSTRRRRVDKALLETPEEEIDYQRLKIRDLILLAEHNERSAKKTTKQSTKPSNGQSVGNASDADDARNKEGSLPYEDGNSSAQPSESVEPTVTLFNYQSFMERTPSTRWSKQATELFYEGIRQFGTDLSMIKELFPSLTRHQVKLKFKKEERQNRLRLFDALGSRAKDHKHFEFVLERLQAAEQAEKESEVDNSEAVTLDDAEDSSPETNGPDEAAKSEKGVDEAAEPEKDEGRENTDTEGNVGKVESPLKSGENGEPVVDDDDDDDDFDFFSLYKSEL